MKNKGIVHNFLSDIKVTRKKYTLFQKRIELSVVSVKNMGEGNL